MRVFSYGGGVQSTAALVLAAHGVIDYGTFLFANVGADSENPDTLTYLAAYAKPYAAAHGLDLIEIQRINRAGQPVTLAAYVSRPESRTIGIPMRGANGAPIIHRHCTSDFKVAVLARWMRGHGATAAEPATVGLGITRDEAERMHTDSGERVQRLAYPLIYDVPRALSRRECAELIAAEGLPIPPKSSCYFCPFHRLAEWREMHDRHPERFAAAVALERTVNARITAQGRKPVWLTRTGRPLDRAIGEAVQPGLFEDDVCESGFCMV